MGIPHLSEAEIRTALAGDASAFEPIVVRWQGPLVNLAYRYCRNRAEAEEMAQEAFLQVYRQRASFRGEAAFSTWLFAVATSVYRSHLRRRPAAGTTVTLEAAPEPFDARPGAAELADDAERREAVHRAVLALPPHYRDAVIQFYFLEQDVDQAAAVLGVPEGTLKARLMRARTLLRERLERSEAMGVRA